MKVFINLVSTITLPDGDTDRITHRGNGMLHQNGPLTRLAFPLEGVMQTLMYETENPSLVELTRGGDRLVFETGRRTEGRYKTEYMTFFPTIMTHRLLVALVGGNGVIELDYTLTIEGESQHFNMKIEVTEAK